MYTYKPKGVCSQQISFEINDGIIENVRFLGGCAGNTQGVAALVQGMPVDEAIKRLSGIQCGFRGTSCPDQFTLALKAAKNGEL